MKKLLTIVVVALLLCLVASFAIASNEKYTAVYKGTTPAEYSKVLDSANWKIIDVEGIESSATAVYVHTPIGVHGEKTLVTVTGDYLPDSSRVSAAALVQLVDTHVTKKEYKVLDDGFCHSRIVCTEDGCGYTSDWSKKADHDSAKLKIEKDADGGIKVICTECGQEVKDPDDSHQHKGKLLFTAYPTCGWEGEFTVVCTVCGEPMRFNKDDWTIVDGKLADEWMFHTVTVEDFIGNMIGKYASLEEWKTAYEKGYYDADGHCWDEWALLSDSTCVKVGVETRVCKVCLKRATSENATKYPLKAVAYAPVTVACDAKEVVLKCRWCDGLADHAAAGVTPGEKVPVQISGGEWTVISSYYSDAKLKTPAITLTHTFDLNAAPTTVIKATCTENGMERWACTKKCGFTEDPNYYITYYKAQLGHKMGAWKLIYAPGTSAGNVYGVYTRECERDGCGYTEQYFATEEYPVPPCDECTWVLDEDECIAPTCTEEGENWYQCSVCGRWDVEFVPALGHTKGAVTVTVEATCTKAGEQVYKCTVCGEYVKETIPALNHPKADQEEVAAVEATCTTVGYTKGIFCKKCNTYISGHEVVAIDPTAHKLAEEKIVKTAATCEKAGEAIQICERCGKAVSSTIKALGHDWTEWTVVTPATVDKKGTEERTCKREGCTEKETREVDFVPTAAAKYTVKDLTYKSPKATGKVELDKETKPLENVYARVTFFLENGECTIQIVPVKADGTFTAGAMGNYVHVSVIIVDTDDAYSATEAIEHAHGNEGIDL